MPKAKQIIQMDVFTQKQIQQFSSIGQAAKITQISKNNIAECCRGLRDTAGNFKWKFQGSEEQPSIILNSLGGFENELYLMVSELKSSKKYQHRLYPKFIYFIHRIIEGRKKNPKAYLQEGVGIYSHTIADIIADSFSTVSKITALLIKYKVIVRVKEANKETNQSARYKLSPDYEKKEIVQEQFDTSYGTMISNMIAWNEFLDQNKHQKWSPLKMKNEFIKGLNN